ncbi:hypothetical protein [Streptomyces sp. NPDC021622]|uniref:hypothetical protein n=1 Tax=Streptomyces sp. NPDC021622 TaxID=3155013 RepID=UPI0033E418A1
MPAVSRLLRTAAIAAVAGAAWLCAAPAAVADQKPPGGGGSFGGGPGSDTSVSGDASGPALSASAKGIVYDFSKNGKGSSAGPVASSSATWTPPACYYAPKYTPKSLESYMRYQWMGTSTTEEWDKETQGRYVDKGGDSDKDFNKDKAGKGHWWGAFVTEGREADPAAQDCDKIPFWVDKGDPPPADAPQAVTPEILAQLAYSEIRVPGTKVELKPQNKSTVNLPTWAWLEKAEFKPVSVTASVPGLGIEATSTAEPAALKIEPGTPDAELHPASGQCPIEGGRIGVPYSKGNSGDTPPCGVTYLRASGDDAYQLKATVTWKIHWTGTGVEGEQKLPDGVFGTEQDVVVQEIQSINR